VKILAVSDVSVGYGSRQIPAIVDSLGDHYGAEKYIIEPDQIEKAPNHDAFPNITIHRIITNIHPHSPGGRIEYIIKASKLIDKIKPNILIISTTFTLPVVFKIHYRPQKTIYYCLESISHYVGDIEINRHIDELVDLIIFPEENRAQIHLETTNTKLPFCIVYNCTNDNSFAHIVSPEQRNGKIIYNGGIHKATAYNFFLNKKIQDYKIDIYGLVEAPTEADRNAIESSFLSLTGNVKYRGYIPFKELEVLRKRYQFSIVLWLPLDENTMFACPNKFFESIYSGIPPIIAPFPQGKVICERYNCGIVMEDFSFNSFYMALKYATSLDNDEYGQLVENCAKAVSNEFNWPNQMQKVVKLLT
jgi:glycosyltransferase involved in cell wall biosynthesis